MVYVYDGNERRASPIRRQEKCSAADLRRIARVKVLQDLRCQMHSGNSYPSQVLDLSPKRASISVDSLVAFKEDTLWEHYPSNQPVEHHRAIIEAFGNGDQARV